MSCCHPFWRNSHSTLSNYMLLRMLDVRLWVVTKLSLPTTVTLYLTSLPRTVPNMPTHPFVSCLALHISSFFSWDCAIWARGLHHVCMLLFLYLELYCFAIYNIYSLLLPLFQGGKASRKLTVYIFLWNATVPCDEPVRDVQRDWVHSTGQALSTTCIATLIHTLQLETKRPMWRLFNRNTNSCSR